jgi:hypothetical protein
MRCYYTTTVKRAEDILRDGFVNLYEECGVRGVYFADTQLNVNDGFEGDVTICLDIPEGDFKQYEIHGDPVISYRMAIMPSSVLNGLGKPQIYDHTYAGGDTRVPMVRAIRDWEAAVEEKKENGEDWESTARRVQGMKDAVAFFDRHGWLTPLKLREAESPK